MRSAPLLACIVALLAAPLAAQTWNSDSAIALARRAVLRRASAAQDTALRDYKARAHGFLFFLGQFGEGLSEPPRLIQADQLELEVYWKTPGLSKQRIAGWRDRTDLPTDIAYHRDHLGIIQNNFGERIRLGEGDEVRDVPHPISTPGLSLYDYALGDTTTIALPERAVRVIALQVRPRVFEQPRIVGTMYVDATTADLVRLSFSFTPAAYLDSQLEDVNIVLDNALWEGRFWLPYRQEIEIRRRVKWLDIPARGIIRGRWEVDGYVFNLGLVDAWFAGREIVALPKIERDSFPWTQPLDVAIRDVAAPVRRDDLERIRAEVQRVAGSRALSGLRPRRLGAQRLSDLVRGNRVEGLALGAGIVWRIHGDQIESRVLGSYGLADERVKGSFSVSATQGWYVEAHRILRDVSDEPVITPLLNSVASLEFGHDYGDYYLAEGAELGVRRGLGTVGEWQLTVGRERVSDVAAEVKPARGQSRPNPALGGTTVSFGRAVLRRRGAGIAARRDVRGEVVFEAGRANGREGYVRLAAAGEVELPVAGSTQLRLRAQGGWGSAHLPAHRAFVLGGRATLLGDAFRAWGGRGAVLGHVEWRIPAGGLHLPAGRYGRLPAGVTVAPYVAAGWTARALPGTPWVATPGVRVTAGLGLELLGVMRFEAGYGAPGRVRFAFDLTRDFWAIL